MYTFMTIDENEKKNKKNKQNLGPEQFHRLQLQN